MIHEQRELLERMIHENYDTHSEVDTFSAQHMLKT